MALLRAFLFGLLPLVVLPGAAAAEIYKCIGADGRERFTANEADCNGRPAQPVKGQVQRAPAASSLRSSMPARPASQAANEEAQALAWRQKKHQAEQKLQRLRADAGTLEQALAYCEEGGQLRLQDPETGLNEVVPCEVVQREAKRALAEKDELEAYLHEGGLEDDCRRSGCLPGWIR
jgi:hypothetical protein